MVAPIRVRLSTQPWMLAVGIGLLALSVVGGVALYRADPTSAPPYLRAPVPSVLGVAIGICIGLGSRPYIRKELLVYDPNTRTLRALDWWWGLRFTYPRKGFDRLEYEAGKFYQARPDGKRRRIRILRGDASREDWRRFIEQFQRDHSPAVRDEGHSAKAEPEPDTDHQKG